jgi:magnesium chelatase accessory protein
MDWPHRTASRFVSAGGIEWHVQVMGKGPCALLLHGTGASTHSFRDLAPALAPDFSVIAVDLPGHGFTGTPPSRRAGGWRWR